MRWTPKDALGHTKLANTPVKRKRWALKANAALAGCEELGRGDCKNYAIQQANAVLTLSTATKKATDGIYLVAPHGRLTWEGRKTIIVKSKQFNLEGTWLIVSKENTKGLAFGVAEVGPVASVGADKFDALFKQHRVTRKEREKWWADSTKFYLYPIKSFEAFDKPAMVIVPPGVQTIMRNVQFIDKKPDVEPGQDRERPQTEEGRPRQADDAENPEEEQKASEEVNMPYTSMEAANPAIRGIKPPVTLAQANLIAKWADAMEEGDDDGPRSPWAVAIAQFKRLYQAQAGKWVKKKKSESEKEFVTLQELLEDRPLDEVAVKARGEHSDNLTVVDKNGKEVSPVIYGNEPDEHWASLDESKDTKETEPGESGGEATDDKGGRRLQSGKLKLLGSLKEKFESLLADLKDLIGWASYDDRKPTALGALFKESTGFKALKALDGRTWLLTWTTNAFEDREREIFTTKSIEDYVARHADEDTKGKYDFWHLPGTEFGTIMWQGIAGRFLVETGPFDDTEIGQKAEEFFLAHPDGHSEFAPEGWGTSHKYKYREKDREDGVYDWFEKQLTTVLPLSAAANPYNPTLEVMMDKKQYQALVTIWDKDIADQVVALGEQRTKELEEADVAFKSKSAEGTKAEDFAAQLRDVAETVEDEALKEKLASIVAEVEKISESKAAKSEDGEGEIGKQDEKELVRVVAEALQLGELSTAFKAFGDVVSTLMEQNKALNTRLETLEQDDETKLAQKEAQLPRYSWFKASEAAETILNKGDALKSRPRGPSVVKNIVGKVES